MMVPEFGRRQGEKNGDRQARHEAPADISARQKSQTHVSPQTAPSLTQSDDNGVGKVAPAVACVQHRRVHFRGLRVHCADPRLKCCEFRGTIRIKLTIIGSLKMPKFHEIGSFVRSRLRIPKSPCFFAHRREIPNIHAHFCAVEISLRPKNGISSESSTSGLALSGRYYLPPKRANLALWRVATYARPRRKEEGTVT